MIPTQTVHLEPLTSALLKELASQQGPCTTFLIRGTTGGGEGSSRAAALRGMLRSTPASLLGPDLLQPVEDFVAQFEDEAGGPGVALFRSPDYFVALTVTGLEANVVLRGNHFALAPLATAVLAPREFYVLALHSKNLHLLHYRNGACEPAPLPAGVPPDLETALAFDAPDRLLEGRSASSRGGGAGHAIQFGTSSAKEAADEYRQQYFRIVDRGLRPLLGNMPLLLAGVHEDVTAYRRLATNTCILETEIGGNIDFLSPQRNREPRYRGRAGPLPTLRGAGAAHPSRNAPPRTDSHRPGSHPRRRPRRSHPPTLRRRQLRPGTDVIR